MERFLRFNIERAEIKTQTFQGDEHLVVPLVAQVEQVILSSNATQPNLVLAEEFGKVPEGWNGRPVVIDHPEINGEKVSANSPDVLESEKIGSIFNSKVEDKKLKLEAWINLATVETKSDEVKAVIDSLQNDDEITEVSTGLFADIEEKSGVFNGEAFEGVWRNIVPDHLAILSDAKGACSVEDGCGAPRVNEAQTCSCGGTCDKCKAQVKNNDTLINRFFNFIKDQRKKLSDVDKRAILNRALRDNVSDFWMVEAIFNKSVVYFTGDRFYEQSYKINSDGSVTFEGDRVEVVPETRFSKVTSNRSGNMDKEKFVDTLIKNEASKFGEDDRTWLMDQEEETLEKLEPVEVVAPVEEPPAEVPAPVAEPSNNSELTVEDYLKDAPASVRETLSHGMTMLDNRRSELVAGILTNTHNTFTEAQLKEKAVDELASIFNLAKGDDVEDYSGRGGERTPTPIGANAAPNPMPQVFDLTKKTA